MNHSFQRKGPMAVSPLGIDQGKFPYELTAELITLKVITKMLFSRLVRRPAVKKGYGIEADIHACMAATPYRKSESL